MQAMRDSRSGVIETRWARRAYKATRFFRRRTRFTHASFSLHPPAVSISPQQRKMPFRAHIIDLGAKIEPKKQSRSCSRWVASKSRASARTPARTASPASSRRATAISTRARCTRSGATTSAPTAAASSRRRAPWWCTVGRCTRDGATTSARTAAAASARRSTCGCTARPSTRRCGRTRAPYCDGVAFGEKSNLTRHLDTVHLERREHTCRYCPGVAFGQKSDLTKHVNMVHLKLREHACPYCPGVA